MDDVGGSEEQRAEACVLGALVGDAACLTTHWCYNDDFESKLGGGDPEFREPPLNGFYQASSGSQTCYGDHTLVVLNSLVDSGGVLDGQDLATKTYEYFKHADDYAFFRQHRDSITKDTMPIPGKWMHGSFVKFLAAYDCGTAWNLCAADDKQIDACTKLPPLIVAYAGRTELLPRVAEAVGLFHSTDDATIGALIWAMILQKLLDGCAPMDAVTAAHDSIKKGSDATAAELPAEVRRFYAMKLRETMAAAKKDVDHKEFCKSAGGIS
mmetsp:Transcript_35138/g.99077  ORF Transcript_35138/g.99077 Transcript_35138/m.99077 type:complete len:268 (-) Transcript_35138:407-1210(-)